MQGSAAWHGMDGLLDTLCHLNCIASQSVSHVTGLVGGSTDRTLLQVNYRVKCAGQSMTR